VDEFGRRFCYLVAGTTLGTVLGPLFVSDSTPLVEYTATIVASAVAAIALSRSRWLDS
jgi:hypothetical protein